MLDTVTRILETESTRDLQRLWFSMTLILLFLSGFAFMSLIFTLGTNAMWATTAIIVGFASLSLAILIVYLLMQKLFPKI